MDGNMAKLIITIATLKQENDRLQKIIDRSENNENDKNRMSSKNTEDNCEA